MRKVKLHEHRTLNFTLVIDVPSAPVYGRGKNIPNMDIVWTSKGGDRGVGRGMRRVRQALLVKPRYDSLVKPPPHLTLGR